MPVLLDLSAVCVILGLPCSRHLLSHPPASFSGPPSVPRRGAAPAVSSPCPLPSAVSSPPLAWAPSVSIWRPGAQPPQAQPGPLPLPPGGWSFVRCGGCCPTRLSRRTWGVLREATSSLFPQRQVNAKTCRVILSSLWKPSPLCHRRHLGSSFHCFWVVAGSLLACLPLCSGSTRLPKLPPEWCF